MSFLSEDQEEQIKADLRAEVAIWSAREDLSPGELLVVAELVLAADGKDAARPHFERAAAAGDKSAIAYLAGDPDTGEARLPYDSRMLDMTPPTSCVWCGMALVGGEKFVPLPTFGLDGWHVTGWHPECEVRSRVGSPAHLRGRCTTKCCGDGSEDGPGPQTPLERRAEALESWLIWRDRA